MHGHNERNYSAVFKGATVIKGATLDYDNAGMISAIGTLLFDPEDGNVSTTLPPESAAQPFNHALCFDPMTGEQFAVDGSQLVNFEAMLYYLATCCDEDEIGCELFQKMSQGGVFITLMASVDEIPTEFDIAVLQAVEGEAPTIQ